MNTGLPMLKECATKAGCRAIDELPVAYMEVDRGGVVCYVNRAALALHDASLGQIIGRLAWDLMPPDEREPSRAAFEQLMRTGRPPSIVRRNIYTNLGEYRTYEVHRGLVLDREGNPAGMRLVSFDVTEEEQARNNAVLMRRWMQSVLESLNEAVIVLDALGFVRYLNASGEALTGWKRDELVGMQIEEGLPLVSFQSCDGSELAFQVVLEQKWKGRAVLLDRSRRQIAVDLSSSPLVDREEGYTTGVVAVLRPAQTPSGHNRIAPPADCDCSPPDRVG